MKYSFATITLISLAVSFIIISSAFSQELVGKDERITIKVDSVIITDEWPSEMRQAGAQNPTPKEGFDYVIVYFTLETINNIHVIGFGGRDDEVSIMHDTKGEQFDLYTWTTKGVRFLDPDAGLSSPSELVEDAKSIMMFEFPEKKQPSELSLFYYFKESWEEKNNQTGIINIKINTTISSNFSQEPVGEDERMSVIVESMERANSFTDSPKTNNNPYGPPTGNTYRPTKRGNDFVIIYFNPRIKKDLNVSDVEGNLGGTLLTDNNGKNHKAVMQSMNFNRFTGLPEGGYLLFSMPLNASPARLIYSYQYKTDSSPNTDIGQVEVSLLNVRLKKPIVKAKVVKSPPSEPSISDKEKIKTPVVQNQPAQKQQLDSILIRNGKFYQRNILLKRSTVLNIVEDIPVAYQEVKSGRSRITWGYILAGFGGISLGGGISTLVFGETSESLDPASGIGVGVACIAGSYLLIKSGAKRFVKGVEIYNSNLNTDNSHAGISMNFGLADHGIGLTITF